MRSALLLALTLAAPAALGSSFDHSAFDALLRRHVVDGMVDYDAFQSAEFRTYLDALDRADPASLDDRERLAFWINVYNAYTIQLVNTHGERESIRNINKTLGLARKGPWREKLVKAGGRVYHLDNVEHDIVRKQWREPRVHFALVCAAMGCPPLRSEAYTGPTIERQLDDQARRFLLGRPAIHRVDVKNAVVHGSPIYVSWYRDDFGSTDATIGSYLARFYPEGAERELLLSGRFKLVATDYDWTLNSEEQAARLAAGPRKP
jgi:hypothetical protein